MKLDDKISGEQAKKVLQVLLNQLSGIDVTDMTTFELNLIRRCAKYKPKNMPQHGIELVT